MKTMKILSHDSRSAGRTRIVATSYNQQYQHGYRANVWSQNDIECTVLSFVRWNNFENYINFIKVFFQKNIKRT
jgi:hypothetical protein